LLLLLLFTSITLMGHLAIWHPSKGIGSSANTTTATCVASEWVVTRLLSPITAAKWIRGVLLTTHSSKWIGSSSSSSGSAGSVSASTEEILADATRSTKRISASASSPAGRRLGEGVRG
jgi:hypothetical protein